jgi:TfoX/Sxy family transcriptional regulator of competence genes
VPEVDPLKLLGRLNELAAFLPFEVTSRPMMGGYIGYADGRTFVSLSSGGFGIKVPPAEQERALARRGAQRLRHSSDDPPSKSYIAFSKIDVADDDLMIEWLLLAGRSAPSKKKR